MNIDNLIGKKTLILSDFHTSRLEHIVKTVEDLNSSVYSKKVTLLDCAPKRRIKDGITIGGRIKDHTDKFDKLKSFDAPYLIGYKRQAEIYSWILSKLGLEIDNTSYFFYVNAKPDQEIFNNSLEFEWTIIPYTTKSYNWVEDTIVEIKNFLETNKIPSSTPDCDLCKYMSKFFDFIKKK